jgi:hypothetical protein
MAFAKYVDDRMHEELVNWSRWCWQGEWPHPLPSTLCGSAERSFHEQWHLGMEPPEPAPIRPNERHARQVQVVWERLHQQARLVLKAEYPARYQSGRMESRDVAARRLGLTLAQYETALFYAVRKVEDAFCFS